MDRKKILIVEDDRSLLKILTEKFANEGYDISEAVNGEEGLEKALSLKPDLILLDILMPVMDGMTMLRELRKHEAGKNIPVMVLTNLSDPQKALEATEVQVFDYLVKSDWKLEDVVDKVQKKLE